MLEENVNVGEQASISEFEEKAENSTKDVKIEVHYKEETPLKTEDLLIINDIKDDVQLTNLTTNNHNSELDSNTLFQSEKEMSKKINSLSKLHGSPVDKSIIIPKENMNNFFVKLASVSKFKTLSKQMNQNTEKKSSIIEEEGMCLTKPGDGIIEERGEIKKEKKEVSPRIKNQNSKPSVFNSSGNVRHRDTALLDARFNIEEILNDNKNNFLLTDEGMIVSERFSYSSSKEDLLEAEAQINKTEFDTFHQKDKKELEKEKLQSIIENIKQMPVYGTVIKPPQKESKAPGRSSITNNKSSQSSTRTNVKTPPRKGGVVPNTTSKKDRNSVANNDLNPNANTNATTANAKSALNSVRMPPKSKSPIYQKTDGNAEGKVSIPGKKPLYTTRINNGKASAAPKGIKTSSMPPVNKSKLASSGGSKSINTSTITTTTATSITAKSPFKKSPMNFISNMKNKNSLTNNKSSKNRLNESLNRLNTNTSKKDVLNTSNYSKKGRKNDSQKSLGSIRKRGSMDLDYKSSLTNEMNVIEEYDYSKILAELRAIFGEELQFFDEDMLFSNLDEMSNKGLIKGLIKLSHIQDKKIKAFDQVVNRIKSQHNMQLREKDREFKNLEAELNNLKLSLRGLINEPCHTEDNILSVKSPSFSKSPAHRQSFNSKTPGKKQNSLMSNSGI